ncbi:MAG: glycosyltransferase [Candidatus Zixiibacteriota bacterium]|nr:MAG: glycosyltransferase [candidate division Zixibacteria bacterium]
MNRNNDKSGLSRMTIGISVLNVQTGSDYGYINRLIECLGDPAVDRTFILIGREEQKGHFIAAPANFSYRFYKLHGPVSESSGPRIDKLFNEVIADFGCDLLLEFGLGGVSSVSLPRVSMINNFKMVGTFSNSGKPSVSRRKLTLINKSNVNNIKNARGIIFSNPYLQHEISRIIPLERLKTTSIYLGMPGPDEESSHKAIARYGIGSRHIVSIVSSEGMKESLRMLKAYCRAFEKDSEAPDLVLVGTNENPRDVGLILDKINKSALQSKIKYIGTIPDEDFSALLHKAHFLVIPSEIFNNADTLVTAMNCGCAILCANKNANQEITGGAALYFDPDHRPDLTYKLKLTADDKSLLDFLRRQSTSRARLFTKGQIAGRLLGFFDDVICDSKDSAAVKTPQNTVAP